MRSSRSCQRIALESKAQGWDHYAAIAFTTLGLLFGTWEASMRPSGPFDSLRASGRILP